MTNTTDTPTVVLVHGGFADASFWVPVHRTIATHLYRVFPKRGITARTELAAALAQKAPRVRSARRAMRAASARDRTGSGPCVSRKAATWTVCDLQRLRAMAG